MSPVKGLYAVSYLHVGSVLKSLSKHQVLPVLVYYFIMFHSLTSELRTSKDLQDLWPLLLFLLCYVNLTCCVFSFFINLPVPVAGVPVDAAGYNRLM